LSIGKDDLLILLLLPFLIIIPSAFADVTVEPIAGSGAPGCEETSKGCWTILEVNIGVGETVTWSNTDNQPHTVTNGVDFTDPDIGTIFDSGLQMNGDSFSFTFNQKGEFPYMCMVHPWMLGTVIVGGSGGGTMSPDTVPPTILTPSDIVVDATNSNGAVVRFEVLAIDDVDEIITPSCTPSSGSFFPIGDTRVTCSAFDSAGNAAPQKSFMVTVKPLSLLIPDWIKEVAAFWCDDKIGDSAFIEGLQYLIDNNVIIVPATTSGIGSSQTIPSWVKNNACWWSNNQISDQDFASGIQYLISQGIIRV